METFQLPFVNLQVLHVCVFKLLNFRACKEIQKRYQQSMLQLSSHQREWTQGTQQCSDQMKKISFKSEAISWQNHCKPIRCWVSPMISYFGWKSFTVSPAAKTCVVINLTCVEKKMKSWKPKSSSRRLGNCLIFPTSTVENLPETFMVPSNPPSQPNLTWGSGEFGSFRLVFLAWKDGTPRGTNRAWWACELENIYDPMTVWSICLFWEMCRKYRCILYTFASSISWANCGLKNSLDTPILVCVHVWLSGLSPPKKIPFLKWYDGIRWQSSAPLLCLAGLSLLRCLRKYLTQRCLGAMSWDGCSVQNTGWLFYM